MSWRSKIKVPSTAFTFSSRSPGGRGGDMWVYFVLIDHFNQPKVVFPSAVALELSPRVVSPRWASLNSVLDRTMEVWDEIEQFLTLHGSLKMWLASIGCGFSITSHDRCPRWGIKSDKSAQECCKVDPNNNYRTHWAQIVLISLVRQHHIVSHTSICMIIIPILTLIIITFCPKDGIWNLSQ